MAKIVLIEGNLANIKLAAFLLRSGAHEVMQATDAETCLALVRNERPALVLMDGGIRTFAAPNRSCFDCGDCRKSQNVGWVCVA